MKTIQSRRKFIHDLSLGVASIATLSLLGGCESLLEQIEHRPIRRRIRNTAEANHQVDIYRRAVGLMKGLPASDARNWTKQASIHNNFCPHGNWFFYPWHRAYLFHFEKICQKLTEEPGFGLPYWDWCVDGSIPAGFWPPPVGNDLYDSTRIATATSITNAGAVGLSLVDGYCNEPDFNLFAGGSVAQLRPGSGGFSGNIEQTPHNYVHGTFIRGNMGNFMSPLDPIFWNHHCMVDLCWYEWNVTRKHPNTNDPGWANFVLKGMFCDADGNSAADMPVIETILMPLLAYQYETGIDGISPPMMALRHRADLIKIQKIVKQGANTKLIIKQRFNIARQLSFAVHNPASSAIPIKDVNFSNVLSLHSPDRAILVIKELSQPPRNDVFLRVFVNKPDADAKTSREDVHYAGSFYFFVHNHEGMDHGAMSRDLLVDISPTLKRLFPNTNAGAPEGITITLVAVPVEGTQSKDINLSATGLELLISPVELQLMDF